MEFLVYLTNDSAKKIFIQSKQITPKKKVLAAKFLFPNKRKICLHMQKQMTDKYKTSVVYLSVFFFICKS